jgi:hypothetical protein
MEPECSLPHSHQTATCPFPEPDQSSRRLPHPNSWKSILVISFHLKLGLQSWLFQSGFPPQHSLWISYFSYPCLMPRLYHSSWFAQPNSVWWGVNFTTILTVQSFVLPFTSSFLSQNIFLSALLSNTPLAGFQTEFHTFIKAFVLRGVHCGRSSPTASRDYSIYSIVLR